ncbi:hypothetical protein ACLB2K_032301 [Fragaria x ananassa]
MDSWVEKLEADVSSLTTSINALAMDQKNIMDQLAEVVLQLRFRPVNEEGEKSINSKQVFDNRSEGGRNGGPTYNPKTVKLDFSRFRGGEDTPSWVCKAEQFFRFHHTPENERVELTSFHLEGDAQLWFQLLIQDGGEVSWCKFFDELHVRYGPNQFQDFFAELAKLEQHGSVREFQSRFERLLPKVGPLSQERQIGQNVGCMRESEENSE